MSQSVCHTKRVERSTDRKFAILHRSSQNLPPSRVPGGVTTCCFAKPKVELIFTIAPMKNSVNVKISKTVADTTIGSNPNLIDDAFGHQLRVMMT